MHHIRPYKIFALIDAPPAERLATVAIPSRRAAGGTSLLETFLLMAAIRIIDARRIFEFGTFLGSNTLNLALNSPADAEILTLDLDENSELPPHAADVPLAQLRMNASLDFAGTPVARKIRALTGNSQSFDFSAWQGIVDLLFIDGGHDLPTLTSDTENSFRMATRGKSSCILWHDYRNLDYPELTAYLDDLSGDQDIFHVEDTMLCAWFNDPAGTILPRLLQK